MKTARMMATADDVEKHSPVLTNASAVVHRGIEFVSRLNMNNALCVQTVFVAS